MPEGGKGAMGAGMGGGRGGRGYLAQHALFEQIPALLGDIDLPDYCALSADEAAGGGVKVGRCSLTLSNPS